MDAINENGMTPDARAPEIRPMTLRQVLEASHTYFGILRALLRADDDATRGRMLAKMDDVTELLEAEVQRQLADPDAPRTNRLTLAPPPPRRLARVA